jgi:hypothetical protein
MTLLVFACVMCAAVLHASWNAVLRGGTDRLWSMTRTCLRCAQCCGSLIPRLSWRIGCDSLEADAAGKPAMSR